MLQQQLSVMVGNGGLPNPPFPRAPAEKQRQAQLF